MVVALCKNCRIEEGHCLCDRDQCSKGVCAPIRCELCGHEMIQSVETESEGGHWKT